jgi:hypothetical protein
MKLVAMKYGLFEHQAPAFALMLAHVYQTGAHYLAMAALVLDQMVTPGDSLLPPLLALECRGLRAAIRVIFEGAAPTEQARKSWERRSEAVGHVADLLAAAERDYKVNVPSLAPKLVIQSPADLHTMARKLVEFDEVMCNEEARCSAFWAEGGGRIATDC